jgi:hypothetical protein
MNEHNSPTMTKADLEALTGAPKAEDLDAPLVKPDELPLEMLRSKRQIWQKPTLKLSMIAFLLLPCLAFAALFLVNSQSKRQHPAQANASPAPNKPDAESAEDIATQQNEALQAQNAQLKADSALYQQDAIIQNEKTKAQERQHNHRPIPEIAPTGANTGANPSTSPQIITRSQPAPIVSAPSSRPEAFTAPDSSQPTSSTDPAQQWQQLAQLGSYGSMPVTVRPEQLATPEWSTDLARSAAQVPTAQITETSAVLSSDIPLHNSSGNSSDWVVDAAPLDASQRQPESPLGDAEASILNAPSEVARSLLAGTTAAGILKTPVVLDEEPAGERSESRIRDRFTVTLTQPLLDATGQMALPANTQLVIQVDHLSPQTGRVQVSAITATWQEQGRTQEIALPAGIIQVRGKDGTPLIAKQFQDKGKEIAALDAGQFLLGAVRGASGQFTRSNTSIQSGNGTTVVTEDNQHSNAIAGALQGGTDAILDTLIQRNQQAVTDIQQRPPIRFVEAGRPVQIFVNQSMRIPS